MKTRFTCLAIAFLMTGCFDIQQSVTLTNKTIEYTRVVRIDSKLVEMTNKGESGKISCADFIDQPQQESVTLELTEKNDSTNLICSGKYSTPYSKEGFISISKALTGKTDTNSSTGSNTPSKRNFKDSFGTNIEDLGRGKYRFVQTFALKQDHNTSATDKENPFTEVGEKFFQLVFAGRTLNWTFTAPEILDTNGKISPDRKSANWEVSVLDATKKQQEFSVEFRAPLPWYLDYWYKFLDFIDSLFRTSGR